MAVIEKLRCNEIKRHQLRQVIECRDKRIMLPMVHSSRMCDLLLFFMRFFSRPAIDSSIIVSVTVAATAQRIKTVVILRYGF